MTRTEDERVYGVGNIILVPHMLLSSSRHFRKPELAGSRALRTYAVLSKGREEGVATYLVQIVNQPH